MKRRTLALVLAYALGQAAVAGAVPVGVLSFDVLIPPDPTDGVNSFSIVNLTGDPATGGAALPPEFPVLTSLTFKGASLRLVRQGGTDIIPLGDIAPGSFTDPSALLQFRDSEQFEGATLSATLNETALLLADGTTFQASRGILARLVPSGGSLLVPGTDFVLIEASPAVAAAAPAAWALVGVGLSALLAWSARGRRAAS